MLATPRTYILGAVKVAGGSIDNLINDGKYVGSISGIPEHPYGSFASFVEVFNLEVSGGFVLQRITALQNASTRTFGCYIRCSYDKGATWDSWNKIDTTVVTAS